MRAYLISLICVLSLALSGCGISPTSTGESPDLPPLNPQEVPTQLPPITSLPDSQTQAINTPDRINSTMTKMPERVPPTEVTTPVTGEVPSELLDAVLADLEKRIGVSPEKITVIQAQAVIWNDGSLGCAKPGEFYIQAVVNGYWLILEVGNRKYDYRIANTGYFFLCEGGTPPNPPSTPNS